MTDGQFSSWSRFGFLTSGCGCSIVNSRVTTNLNAAKVVFGCSSVGYAFEPVWNLGSSRRMKICADLKNHFDKHELDCMLSKSRRKKISFDEIVKSIKFDRSKTICDIFDCIVKHCGVATKIKVDRRNIEKIIVSRSTENKLQMIPRSKIVKKEFIDSLIVVYDGFVDSAAQCDRLFQHAFSTKIPLVIVCRGSRDDVISTIDINNARGNFDIALIEIPFDEKYANLLYDIAFIVGSEAINCDSGIILSSIDPMTLKSVRSVKFDNSGTAFNSLATNTEIGKRLNSLSEKVTDASLEFFSKRFEFLSNDITTVTFPHFYSDNVIEELLDMFMIFKSFVLHGSCDLNQFDESFQKRIKRSFNVDSIPLSEFRAMCESVSKSIELENSVGYHYFNEL